jgi:hypothetical protein
MSTKTTTFRTILSNVQSKDVDGGLLVLIAYRFVAFARGLCPWPLPVNLIVRTEDAHRIVIIYAPTNQPIGRTGRR